MWIDREREREREREMHRGRERERERGRGVAQEDFGSRDYLQSRWVDIRHFSVTYYWRRQSSNITLHTLSHSLSLSPSLSLSFSLFTDTIYLSSFLTLERFPRSFSSPSLLLFGRVLVSLPSPETVSEGETSENYHYCYYYCCCF